jgi:translation elongation factor EF-G
MDAGPRVFPPRPIRGVRATYAHQTSCPGDFASVTVDFEPGEPGFAFEVAEGAAVEDFSFPEALPGFHAALAEGMREELAELGDGVTVAVAVVVQAVRVHDIDSRDSSFRMAGRLAVRKALASIGEHRHDHASP